ncbi:unnamed protein product [Spirodela intermedia]|uniref:Uncharacterized protein n=1 Tax=Spirodela intermedia TaxID=51605 RepID=A0A7I8LK68_SPIIN|nr:unnamed protein product [Spirodela intermedia]
MGTEHLDFLLVPLGLLAVAAYHAWLIVAIHRKPERTVIGLNSLARRRWVDAMMSDPQKNGVLAVQTVRNNIMASTVLATTAITLASLIGVFTGISTSSSQPPPSSLLVLGNKAPLATSVKFFAITVCFMLAFLCHVQSIRYYAHVSFLVSVPPSPSSRGGRLSTAYVARSLNRGGLFWSLGLRAFYVSFNLFLWIFGPIAMFVSCYVMVCMLYFLDTTTKSTRDHNESLRGQEEMKEGV